MKVFRISLKIFLIICFITLSVLAIGFLLNDGFNMLKTAWVENKGFNGFFGWFFTKFLTGRI